MEGLCSFTSEAAPSRTASSHPSTSIFIKDILPEKLKSSRRTQRNSAASSEYRTGERYVPPKLFSGLPATYAVPASAPIASPRYDKLILSFREFMTTDFANKLKAGGFGSKAYISVAVVKHP